MSKNDKLLSERLQKIKNGLQINNILMKDGLTGKIYWECNHWDLNSSSHTANISKDLLNSKVIVRNVNFSSTQQIENLEIYQNFYLLGDPLEHSRFQFNFVIPGSTNDWEQIIHAKEDGVLPADLLSGKLRVETLFLCEGYVLWRNMVTVFYV